MFKRILVAVDGSHTSEQALREAARLAGSLQAQLRIVHVVDNVNLNLGMEFPNPTEIWDALARPATTSSARPRRWRPKPAFLLKPACSKSIRSASASRK